VTVDDSVDDYVDEIRKALDSVSLDDPIKNNALRYSVDYSSDSLGKKIRRGTGLKIPCILIVGPKDKEAREVSVRLRDKEEKVTLEKLGEYLRNLK
jgi:threonyl-tRNA synthetase